MVALSTSTILKGVITGRFKTTVLVVMGVAACLLLWHLHDSGATQDGLHALHSGEPEERSGRSTTAVHTDVAELELEPAPEVESRTANPHETATARSGTTRTATKCAGSFEFDVEFAALDALDRPLAGVEIDGAPADMPLDKLGTTAWDGRLHVQWRGFDPEIELVVQAARGPDMAGDLRRVIVHAGTKERVTLGAFAQDVSLRSGTYEIVIGSNGDRAWIASEVVRSKGVETLSMQIDEYGNGVFVDPYLVPPVISTNEPGSPARPAAFGGRRPSGGRRLGGRFRIASLQGMEPETPSIRGFLYEPDGRPAAGVSVFLVSESNARRMDTTTDENGAFLCDHAPPGQALLIAGGSGHARLEQHLVLEPGETRFERMIDDRSAVHVRLTDENGIALANWRVEAWSRAGETSLLCSRATDAAGRTTLVPDVPSGFRLLARPGDGLLVPSIVLSDRAWSEAGELEYSVRGARSLAAITVRLDSADGKRLDAAEVHLWRADRLSGIALGRAARSDDEVAGAAWTTAGLIPGVYRLEAGAPAQPWTDLGEVVVTPGAQLDLGVRALAARAELDAHFATAPLIEGAASANQREILARDSAAIPDDGPPVVRERAIAQIEHRLHGAIVQSPTFSRDLPARFPIPAGKSVLTWTRHARRGGVGIEARSGAAHTAFEEKGTPSSYDVDGIAGRVAPLELEPLQR